MNLSVANESGTIVGNLHPGTKDIVIELVKLWLKYNYQPQSRQLNLALLSALNQEDGRAVPPICRSLMKIIFLICQSAHKSADLSVKQI